MEKAFRFGTLAGIVCSFWFLAEFYLGLHQNGVAQYSTFGAILLFFVIVYRGIHTLHKEHSKENKASAMKSLSMGFFMSISAAFIPAAAVHTYYKELNPSFSTEMIKIATQKLKEAGKTEAELQQLTPEMTAFYSAPQQAVSTLIGIFTWGMVFTLLCLVQIHYLPMQKK